MGVPPYVTSSGLSGAVAQRLVRRLCDSCKRPAAVSWDRLVAAGMGEDEAMGLVVYESQGCQECGMTGYNGRIAVFEVMEFDDHIESLFLHNAPSFEIQQAAVGRGMRTLRRDALDKVKQGVTSLDEVDRVVV
jgi:type IV pilus assembly protein PilB